MRLSRTLEASLSLAVREARTRRHEYLCIEHVLYALLHDESVAEVIRAYTIDAAASFFAEPTRGSLEPGKRADLVVIGRDPYAMPANELAEVSVDLTLVDGRVVYERTA